MYAQDNPERFKLVDPSLAKGEGPTQVYADWSNSLRGKLKNEFDRSPVAFFRKHFNRKL